MPKLFELISGKSAESGFTFSDPSAWGSLNSAVVRQHKKCFGWRTFRGSRFVSKMSVAVASLMRHVRCHVPTNPIHFGDIFYLLTQILPERFCSHWYRRWAKVLIIRVQVRFDDSTCFRLVLSSVFAWAKKERLSMASWTSAFPPFISLTFFLNGVCDSSERCHALHNGCLHALFEKVGLVTQQKDWSCPGQISWS